LQRSSNTGAIVTFTGLVREFYQAKTSNEDDAVQSLYLEHYPGMTEKALEENYIPTSLGNSRLRTETAGIVACTLLNQ